jgi:hypothetical protein
MTCHQNAKPNLLTTFARLTARRFVLAAPALVSLAAGSSQAREFAACVLILAAVAFAVESVVRTSAAR